MMRALLVTALLVLCSPTSASAGTRRLALIVGNNAAGPAKEKLHYAERDARRMAKLLRQLGGVSEVSLLLGGTADALRTTLARLARKTRTTSDNTVLIFYYSGHADNKSLLMGGSRYPFKELRSKLKQFPARTAISFIDACQSGQITRTKGGRTIPVVDVRFDDQPINGRVFITSSAAGESSQESDELQASLFTHYLMSGLRGGADDSGDGKVSLEEAYRFAYRHTLSRTSSTVHGPQHPSYQMDLTGTGQFTLTWLSPRLSYLVLKRRARGAYYIHQKSTGVLVAEINKLDGRMLRIALAPGEYEVRKAQDGHEMVKAVQVVPAGAAVLDEANMVRRPLRLALRKGGDSSPASLSLSYNLRTGYLDQAKALHGVRAGFMHVLGPVELGGFIGFGHGSYLRDDQIAVSLNELTLLASVQYRMRLLPWLSPVAALDGGGSWVWQRGDLPGGQRQTFSKPIMRYCVRLGAEVPLAGPLMLGIWGHLGHVFLDQQSGIIASFGAGLQAGLIFKL